MKKVVFLENAKGNKSYVKSFNHKNGYMAFTGKVNDAQRCDDETVDYYKKLGGKIFEFHVLEVDK